MSIKILGISCYYHDSAATLLVDGEIISAVQEERLNNQGQSQQKGQNHKNVVCLYKYKQWT